jgi:hypothetical protein
LRGGARSLGMSARLGITLSKDITTVLTVLLMQRRACPVDSFALVRFRLLAPPAGIHPPAQQREVGSGETIGRHLLLVLSS